MCILKAWELARLILPSISSRAPDKTHLPAPQQDHGILFDRRRTPRVFRWGFSVILVFASFRRTPRNSRDGLASPAIMCECAMEPIGPSRGFCSGPASAAARPCWALNCGIYRTAAYRAGPSESCVPTESRRIHDRLRTSHLYHPKEFRS